MGYQYRPRPRGQFYPQMQYPPFVQQPQVVAAPSVPHDPAAQMKSFAEIAMAHGQMAPAGLRMASYSGTRNSSGAGLFTQNNNNGNKSIVDDLTKVLQATPKGKSGKAMKRLVKFFS